MNYTTEIVISIIGGGLILAGVIVLLVLVFKAAVEFDKGQPGKPAAPKPVYEGLHAVTVEGTEGVAVTAWCTCRDWNANFVNAGAVEMWARGHLMDATGSPYNPDGEVPTLDASAGKEQAA